MGREGTCDDCQQPYAVWFASNEVWNFVMSGGATTKPEWGGMLCPRCFALRAEGVYQRPIWHVRLESSEPPEALMSEQPTGIVLRVPLDRALDNREGHCLNVGVDHIHVPVFIDPGLTQRGETQNTYSGRRIVLREWNEQVLLHELLHVALTRITPMNTVVDDPHDHNIIARIEVALWETGWRLRDRADRLGSGAL